MGQSKLKSLLEAGTNTVVAMSYAVLLYMWVGFTPLEGLGFTAIFAVAGVIRAFVVRRLFEWWDR